MGNLLTLLSLRKELISEFKETCKLLEFKRSWRRENVHNNTFPINRFPKKNVCVGNYSYGGLRVISFGNPNEYLSIGNYCSIASDVVFLLGGEHDYKRLSTFPVWEQVLGKEPFEYTPTNGPIIIEDDVWIGYGAIVLSGTHVERGSVIGAGSVVRGRVPAYSVYIGNEVKKSRFAKESISQIKDLDLDELFHRDIREIEGILKKPLNEASLDDIL